MAIPSTNEFLTRFPEFGEQSTSVVEGALAEATLDVPETVYGTRQYAAVGFLAAHILATRTMQLGLQVGTMSGTPQGDLINSTLYGQEYKRIQDNLPLTGFTF